MKKRKTAKKLNLARETVVQLDDALSGVAGGCQQPPTLCPACGSEGCTTWIEATRVDY